MTPDLHDNVDQQKILPVWAGLRLLVINTALYWQQQNWFQQRTCTVNLCTSLILIHIQHIHAATA